jgi:glutamyl-tRNA reductase
VRHLFLVASSLDSMVIGDAQIASQVKQAYDIAARQQTAGPTTRALFQAATRTARRVAHETAIHVHRVSIPSVAVAELARWSAFETFANVRTLVLGAGELAEETLRYLRKEGACELTVVNRSLPRAAELGRRHNGVVKPWSERFELLKTADLAIGATDASQPIVTRQRFAEIERYRDGRRLSILDLAVPRDFDPEIGKLPGVYLLTIDELRKACERNRKLREQEMPKALRIVEEETDRFGASGHLHDVGPTILSLREAWSKPKDLELQRLFNKLPNLSDESRDEIAQSFDRLTNKLFHPPLETIRMEARKGKPTELLDALTRLFRCRAA